MSNKIGIPLEGLSMKVVRPDNLDEVVATFERHVADILENRFGERVRIETHILEDGNEVILLPILVTE